MDRLLPGHGRVGLLLVAVGEALIIAHTRPLSDFYFPFAWLGYILLLDSAILQYRGRSLFVGARALFLMLFPISAAFWWIFELFNQSVHNWIYVGGEAYQGMSYVAIASIDFSFVLPAVWTSALFLHALLPASNASAHDAKPSDRLLGFMFVCGGLCLILPILVPRFAFGLIWACLFFLLDPINHRLGRPSMVASWARRDWRPTICFACAALMCGFFWEAWNFWAMPKWVYAIPFVNRWHIFEMPLLGWTGYLPFGLELFAMTNFVLPLLGLEPLSLGIPSDGGGSHLAKQRAS